MLAMLKRVFGAVRRRWYVFFGGVLAVLLVVAFLFPYLLKRYVESHSEEWIARRVSIGRIVLNPFTGTYSVNEFTCYEPKSDQVFVSFKKLGVKADLIAGYREGVWRFRNAELRTPFVRIDQNGDRFNFSDLLELVGGPETEEPEPDAPVRFDVTDLRLTDGQIDYTSDVLHAPASLLGLNVSCSRISSGQAVMDFLISFAIGGGGNVDGGFTIDTERGRYAVNARLREFGLAQVLPYLQDVMDCSALTGSLDADLCVKDSYADSSDLALSAGVALRDMEVKDPANDVLLRIKELKGSLDTLQAAQQRFELGEVLLDGAGAHFVMLNDGTDNWTRLLKSGGDTLADGTATTDGVSESNIFVMLADYISYLGAQFVASDYSARSVKVTECAVRFEDYTPRIPFKYDLGRIALSASRISSDQDAGHISVSASLNSAGTLTGSASFDPLDLRNVTIDMEVGDLRLEAFDAYSRWYAAHPLEAGVLSYRTKTSILSGRIDSQNGIRVDRLKFGKKVAEHDTGIYVLPLRLAASLLKDTKGVVQLEVPLSGDLRDPQFRAWPIVWQVLKNLILKAVTAPANLLARAVGGGDESELEGVRFEPCQFAPAAPQRKVLDRLVRVLEAKEDLRVDLVPLVDERQELQELALFKGKSRSLFGEGVSLSASDSVRVAELANTDPTFVQFVESATPMLAGKPIQERCLALVGREAVAAEQQEIEYARRESVMQYLLAKGLSPARVAYRPGTAVETAGRTGPPGFRFIFDAADDPAGGDASSPSAVEN